MKDEIVHFKEVSFPQEECRTSKQINYPNELQEVSFEVKVYDNVHKQLTTLENEGHYRKIKEKES